MLNVTMFAAGAIAVIVAAFLRHLQRWSISPPLLGLVVGVVLGPQVLGVLHLPAGQDIRLLTVAARLLLAVALMAIALRYPIAVVRQRVREVGLLLLIVLPFMAMVLTLGAAWSLQLPLAVSLILGVALSPTDPVLASGIVTGQPAEEDIPGRSRQQLSLESGANDGLAMPLVVIALALALGRALLPEVGRAVYEVVGGLLVGAAGGFLAGRALRWGAEHREIEPSVRAVYTLVVAFAVLGLGGLLRVDGLLSVFVAGLVHNRIVTGGERVEEVGIDESLNHFLVIPVFLLLGAALPWREWIHLGWGAAAFLLIMLLLRRLPAVLALRRPLNATWVNVGWLGWFGPIGVAALYYLGHSHEQGVHDPEVWAAGTLVIVASTVVHSLSAGAGRVAYRRSGSGAT